MSKLNISSRIYLVASVGSQIESFKIHGNIFKISIPVPFTLIFIPTQLPYPEPQLNSLSPELPSSIEKKAWHINCSTQPAEHIARDIQEVLFKTFDGIKIIILLFSHKLNFLYEQQASCHKISDSIWQTQRYGGVSTAKWRVLSGLDLPQGSWDTKHNWRQKQHMPTCGVHSKRMARELQRACVHCIKEFKSGVAGTERQTFPFARWGAHRLQQAPLIKIKAWSRERSEHAELIIVLPSKVNKKHISEMMFITISCILLRGWTAAV